MQTTTSIRSLINAAAFLISNVIGDGADTGARRRNSAARVRPTAIVMATLVLSMLFTPHDASAQFRVCNRTSKSVSIATAYRAGGEWVTRGWFNAAPGECATPVSGSLQQRYYYVFAESSTGSWTGDFDFCTEKKAFTYRGRPSCTATRQEQSPFMRIDTGMSLSYTLTLTSKVGPEKVHAAIDAVSVSWRESFAVDNTWVMRLHNDMSASVSFTVKCYSRSGSYSQSFPVTISAHGFTEIGFLEGWPGNFTRGERCYAYHGDERVWRADAGVARPGR